MVKHLVLVTLNDFLKNEKNLGEWAANEITSRVIFCDDMEAGYVELTKDLNCWEISPVKDFQKYLKKKFRS